MFGSVRRASASLVVFMLLTTAATARAWVEHAVKSDSVTLDVERDGTAVVSHELLLWVRGGPLPEISVAPIDADAELLDGATVTRAESGRAAGLPVPLSATKEESLLTLHVVGEKGLRSGTYQIRFGYRTSLSGAGRLHAGTAGTVLEWNGPSFVDGIDSERVVFRLPTAGVPPRLGTKAADAADDNVADEAGGVFLATFRRASDKDELEIVRPHVAKGEIVSWRITADASIFDVHAPLGAPVATVALAPPSAVVTRAAKPRPETVVPYVVATFLSLLFGAVVVLKSRWVATGCRDRRATPRPLLPIGTPLRAVLATAGVLGAVVLVIVSAPPLVAATILIVALAAATELSPRAAAPLRGPGKWVRLSPEAAFDDGAPVRSPGRFLDAGTPFGFVLFAALLVGFVAGAIALMRRSEYFGLSLALASAVLFPIFCTGRVSELPPDPVRAPIDLLEFLAAQFGKEASLETSPLGRVPNGRTEHDELRLLVSPKRSLTGFIAIEIGLDVHPGALGPLSLPFVLVRVIEGSAAAEALPKGLFWTRGRNSDERVAVLRPKVPTRGLTARLASDVARRLSVSKGGPPQGQSAPTSVPRSSGKGSVAANSGTMASPAHAT